MLPVVGVVVLLQQTAWATVDHAFWLFAVPLGLLSMVVYSGLLWWFAGRNNRAVLKQILGPIVRALLRRIRPAK
jgi:teichuronic acid exporter